MQFLSAKLEKENIGLVKTWKQSSYLFGLLGSETVIEFYPIKTAGEKDGRIKK